MISDPQKPTKWPYGPVNRTDALSELSGVHKWFGEAHVLRNINLAFYPGEVVAIIGPSGSGKSTLLRTLNMLETPSFGIVRFKGRDITDVRVDLNRVRTRMGIVFQSYNLFPHRSVLANVTFGLRHVLRLSKREADTRAMEELCHVGLEEKMHEYPGRLSGGQQQRVAIARALAMRPDMLLFDEITSALDPELVGEVLEVLRRLAGEQMTMVLVTHEMGFAREVASRIVFVDEGIVVETGAPHDMLRTPKSQRLERFLSSIL